MVLGCTKPPYKGNRGYSDHTELTECKKFSMTELRSELCDINETPLYCRCLAVVNSVGDIPATNFTWVWTYVHYLT